MKRTVFLLILVLIFSVPQKNISARLVIIGNEKEKPKEEKTEDKKETKVVKKKTTTAKVVNINKIEEKETKEEIKEEKIALVAPINLNNKGVRISSYFGKRVAPKEGASTFHNGIDIAAPKGTHIYAIMDGVITEIIEANGSAGNTVKIKHENETESIYMHMSKRSIKVGDKVKAGEVIGTVGNTGNSTGNHLHFEIKVDGKHMNPVLVLKCNLGICKQKK